MFGRFLLETTQTRHIERSRPSFTQAKLFIKLYTLLIQSGLVFAMVEFESIE